MNKRAEAYIDTVVIVIVCVMVIFVNLNIFNYIVMYQKTSEAADQIINQVAMTGTISGTEFDDICKNAFENQGFKEPVLVDVSLSEQIDGSTPTCVQYGDRITIVVKNAMSIRLLGKNEKRVLPIEVKRNKPSEVYWKPLPDMNL